MDQYVLCFFDRNSEALPMYEAFEKRVFSEIGSVKVKVQKTQIAFSNRHNFAFVSFLPVRKAKERPEVYIVVTFGLGYRVESPRIDVAVEPYPGRFTHHVLISGMWYVVNCRCKHFLQVPYFSGNVRLLKYNICGWLICGE